MATRLSYGAETPQIPRCFDLRSSKITIMGDDLSGKTSLVRSWLNSTFPIPDANHCRVSDIYHKTVQFDSLVKHYHNLKMKSQPVNTMAPAFSSACKSHSDNKKYTLEEYLVDADTCNNRSVVGRRVGVDVQIFDTNQIEISCYSELTAAHVKQSDAIILCFDSSDESSFASLECYICMIHQVSLNLRMNIPIIIACTKCDLISERKIGYDEVLAFLQDLNFSPNSLDYFETSSKFDTGVEDLFFAALLKIERSKSNSRKQLQGFVADMCPVDDSKKTCEVEDQANVNASLTSQSTSTSSKRTKTSKKSLTRKGESPTVKASFTKTLSRACSPESLSNNEKKKLKKCLNRQSIRACCIM